jgi:hypothetical protein
MERSIAAIRYVPDLRNPAPAPADEPDDVEVIGLALLDSVPAGLVDLLATVPEIRVDRVAAARARMEAGDEPLAADIADKLVARMVCDRLR